METKPKTVILAIALALALAAMPSGQAAAKGLETMAAQGGVAPPWSPYRYTAVAPRHPKAEGRTTTLLQVSRRGGEVQRWWFLRGTWMTPALAYDGSGGGLSADGGTLVLAAYRYAYPRPGRWTSRFAIVDTELETPRGGGGRHPVRRIILRGDFKLVAVSPDGSTVYLHRYPRMGYPHIYELRALDVASGRLLPDALFDSRRQRRQVEGQPVTAIAGDSGSWAYTLFDGHGEPPYLQALNTVAGSVTTVRLPQLDGRDRALLRLRLKGGDLLVRSIPGVAGQPGTDPLLSIDTRTWTVREPAERFLGFTATPRRPGNLLARHGVVGHSREGRPIELRQLGDPAIEGKTLVFGCIHGDECAGSAIEPLVGGCPDPLANVYVVRNLDPDGSARGSRLNANGVDLNRNFPSEWAPIGPRGHPEHAGPRPFSEPESRLAARIVRRLRPRVTIWFHQYGGTRPFVRAWGPSAPAGRRFARLARVPFRLLRWPAGTAPNWQNHRFPGTSSFVVELPPGQLKRRLRERLGAAVDRLSRWEARVGED